ncbi:MAG TPA: Rap1a/Tai family immunity protein [Allosphingosinicella sp.]|nr:Rap1a/Tai family immunity protein [Allosphingosinicella sp.]
MRTASKFMLALALTAGASPGAALAQTGRVVSATDGASLAAACSSQRPADQGYCYGYVTGIADQLAVEGAICLPAQFDQVIMLVRSHLAASGSESRKHATFLVGRVLKATYTCRR